jgi:hypothetical protein
VLCLGLPLSRSAVTCRVAGGPSMTVVFRPFWHAHGPGPSRASSSRSQVTMQSVRAAACLTWDAPSVDVRWRLLLPVVIVTHLVTRQLASRFPERVAWEISRARRSRLALLAQALLSVNYRAAPVSLPGRGAQRARDNAWLT